MKLATITANLRAGNGVVFCPSCQRILLVWPGFVTPPEGEMCPNCKIIELETVNPPDGSLPAVAK